MNRTFFCNFYLFIYFFKYIYCLILFDIFFTRKHYPECIIKVLSTLDKSVFFYTIISLASFIINFTPISSCACESSPCAS